MPSENKTPHYSLNQWQGNEFPQRVDFVADNAAIDAAIFDAGTHTAIHTKTGITHNLQVDPGAKNLTFLATADIVDGDTWTVNGNPVTAVLQNGEALPGELFKAGCWVTGVYFDGTKLGFRSAGGDVKYNVFCQPDEPTTKAGIWLQTPAKISVKALVNKYSFKSGGHWNANFLKPPVAGGRISSQINDDLYSCSDTPHDSGTDHRYVLSTDIYACNLQTETTTLIKTLIPLSGGINSYEWLIIQYIGFGGVKNLTDGKILCNSYGCNLRQNYTGGSPAVVYTGKLFYYDPATDTTKQFSVANATKAAGIIADFIHVLGYQTLATNGNITSSAVSYKISITTSTQTSIASLPSTAYVTDYNYQIYNDGVFMYKPLVTNDTAMSTCLYDSILNTYTTKSYSLPAEIISFGLTSSYGYHLIGSDLYFSIVNSAGVRRVCCLNIVTGEFKLFPNSAPPVNTTYNAWTKDPNYLYGAGNKLEKFIVESEPLKENSVALLSSIFPKFRTEIMNAKDSNLMANFVDAYLYQDGIYKDYPAYYGAGTQWIKFKEGN